jgi:hypothetical protein
MPGGAVAERPLVPEETLAILSEVVNALAPDVYDAYAAEHHLDPAELHRRKECEGVSDKLRQAMAERGLHTRMREFRGAAPDDRHYFPAWSSVVIDPTYQQFVEGRTPEQLARLPRVLVCREQDLEVTLLSYGVPARKLNHWTDARDRPVRVKL